MSNPSDQTIILLGHGSRDPLWRQSIEAVRQRLVQRSADLPVRCAYLEFDRPDLSGAVTEVVALGARRITIVPMFFGCGKHVREDLPARLDGLRRHYPDVDFHLQRAVGDDPRVLDLLATIASE